MTRSEKVRRIRFRGVAEYQGDANGLIELPGDVAIVERGVARSFVMACPDGCGEQLVVNLDTRTGPPWTLYRTKGRLSLYPSVWRDSGCGSHFIIWQDRILWCSYEDRFDDDEFLIEDEELVDRVFEALGFEARHYVDISHALDEIPWEVSQACRRLVRARRAIELAGRSRGRFKRL